MDVHFNLFIPMACPHCLTELMPTLDAIHDEDTIQCTRCGTTIELRLEDLPIPEVFLPGLNNSLSP